MCKRGKIDGRGRKMEEGNYRLDSRLRGNDKVLRM